MGNLVQKEASNKNHQQNYDFEKVSNSQEFRGLMKAKKRFLIPLTIMFLSLYFLLPILTSYTTILNKPAIGSISWTWVYSIGLFIMTWILCMVYVKKAGQYDQTAQEIIQKYEKQGDQNV